MITQEQINAIANGAMAVQVARSLGISKQAFYSRYRHSPADIRRQYQRALIKGARIRLMHAICIFISCDTCDISLVEREFGYCRNNTPSVLREPAIARKVRAFKLKLLIARKNLRERSKREWIWPTAEILVLQRKRRKPKV